MTVIDTHTHILNQAFVDLLSARGGPEFTVKVDRSGGPAVHRHGAPFMIHSRSTSRSSLASCAPGGINGAVALVTANQIRLSANFPGISAGPRVPPFKAAARELRFNPDMAV